MSSAAHVTKRIVIFTSGPIGDALMTLAVAHEISERNLEVQIHIFARRNTRLVQDLAAGDRYLHVHPITFAPQHLLRLFFWSFSPWCVLSLWSGARKGRSLTRFIRLFALHPHSRAARFAIQAPFRCDDVVAEYDLQQLVIDNFRRLAQSAGFDTSPVGAAIAFPIITKLPDEFPFFPGTYIVFHPFGSALSRTYSQHKSRELLHLLRENFPELGIVITGSAVNASKAAELTASITHSFSCTNLPIQETAGIIDHAACYIGVDTGTTHLASVMQKKVIELGNLAGPQWLASYNPNATILYNDVRCTCDGKKGGGCRVVEDGVSYLRCFFDIQNETVIKAVREKLVQS